MARKAVAIRSAPAFDGSLNSMAELVREPSETPNDARRRLAALIAGEPDMEKFRNVVAYQASKPADLDLEACLKRAGIDRSEGFGLVCRVLHRYAFDISRVVTALALARHSTDVAEALCRSASYAKGAVDRRTFYQMTGMLRPGGGVNVQVNATAEAGAAAKSEAPSAPRGLPNFEEAMKEIGSALRVLDVPAQ